MDEITPEQLFKQLNEASDDHASVMTEMAEALTDLSKASDKTLAASRKAIESSKNMSSLLMIILHSQETDLE